MLKLVKTCVAAVSLVVASGALAEKIAVLNPQQAMLETDLAKTRLKNLEAKSEFKSARAQAEKLDGELRSMVEAYQKDQSILSEEQRKAEEKKLKAKNSEREKAIEKLQKQQQPVAQGVMQELAPKYKEVVQAIIKEKGITLLMGPQGVLHADPSADITAEVTKRLNAAK